MVQAKILQVGENIPAVDYNEIVRRVLRDELGRPEPEDFGELYGEFASSVEAFSIFEFYDNAPTLDPARADVPRVGVREHSGSPLFLTNGEIATVANQETAFNVMVPGLTYKIRSKNGDSFSIGDECGPEEGQTRLTTGSSGLIALSPNFVQNSTDYVLVTPLAGGSNSQFFTLLEDMPSGHGRFAYAQLSNWDGNTTVEKVYQWFGVLDDATAGHKGRVEKQGGRWTYENSAFCPEKTEANGNIDYAEPIAEGTVGVAYGVAPSVRSNIVALSVSFSNLPPGLSGDTSTGDITGTPTTAGTYGVTVTAQVPAANGTGNVTITRYRIIVINEA